MISTQDRYSLAFLYTSHSFAGKGTTEYEKNYTSFFFFFLAHNRTIFAGTLFPQRRLTVHFLLLHCLYLGFAAVGTILLCSTRFCELHFMKERREKKLHTLMFWCRLMLSIRTCIQSILLIQLNEYTSEKKAWILLFGVKTLTMWVTTAC